MHTALPIAALAFALAATAGHAQDQTTAPAVQAATTPALTHPATPLRATQIIGASILNHRRETIGQVDDLPVPSAPGRMIAVISVGGFLGMRTPLVSVPFSDLSWNARRQEWTLPRATKEDLAAPPVFTHAERIR